MGTTSASLGCFARKAFKSFSAAAASVCASSPAPRFSRLIDPHPLQLVLQCDGFAGIRDPIPCGFLKVAFDLHQPAFRRSLVVTN